MAARQGNRTSEGNAQRIDALLSEPQRQRVKSAIETYRDSNYRTCDAAEG